MEHEYTLLEQKLRDLNHELRGKEQILLDGASSFPIKNYRLGRLEEVQLMILFLESALSA